MSPGRWWPARWPGGSSATSRPGSGSACCSSCSRSTCCRSAPSRYPDYGPATVAAAVARGGRALGARAGSERRRSGWCWRCWAAGASSWSRRVNARAIQHRAAALAAGESPAIRRLQYGGLARDAAAGRRAHRARARWRGWVARRLRSGSTAPPRSASPWWPSAARSRRPSRRGPEPGRDAAASLAARRRRGRAVLAVLR